MKFKVTILALCGATLLAVLSAVVIGRPHPNGISSARQTFEVKGRIRSLEAGAKTVRINHEEIPNYMPAMTMPFAVKDAAALEGLAVGDAVRFQLVTTDDDSWISRIEKIPDGGRARPATVAETGEAAQVRETERLQVGEKVPDFTLTDQDGHSIRLGDFRGKVVVLTFIFTRCPLPNFCPLMSKNFAALQERLAKEFPGKFRLLSVSIDPVFDRPRVLKHYAARYNADERLWTFGTGTVEQIELVAGLLGLTYEAQNGLIAHDLRTALIGPDGKLIHVWKSNAWTPFEVQRMVRETLTGQRDVAAK